MVLREDVVVPQRLGLFIRNYKKTTLTSCFWQGLILALWSHVVVKKSNQVAGFLCRGEICYIWISSKRIASGNNTKVEMGTINLNIHCLRLYKIGFLYCLT